MPQDFSEERIQEVLSWSEADQKKWYEEAFNEMPRRMQAMHMADIDEDLNIFSARNRKKQRKARAKAIARLKRKREQEKREQERRH